MDTNLKEKAKDYEQIANIIKGIENNEIEIQNLEDEMYKPGADMVLLNEQMEKYRRDNDLMYNKLDEMGVKYKNEERNIESSKSKISISQVGILFGKKLQKVKQDFTNKISAYANRSKEAIMKKADDIAKKREKQHRGSKVKIANILLAVAVAGLAGENIKNAIQNGKPKTSKPNPTAGVEEIIQDSKEKQQNTVSTSENEHKVNVVTPRFVVNKNNLYRAYRINSNLKAVNYRSEPSTSNGSNIIMKLDNERVVYVKEGNSDINNGNDGHNWHKCIVFGGKGDDQTKYKGYVDLDLLVPEENMGASNAFEADDVEVIVDDEREIDKENEIQLDAYAVDVDSLNVRDEPNLIYGMKMDVVHKGDTIYSFPEMNIDVEDPDREWKHVMYRDDSVYRTCFVDGSYLKEKADFVESASDIEVSNNEQDNTEAVEPTTQDITDLSEQDNEQVDAEETVPTTDSIEVASEQVETEEVEPTTDAVEVNDVQADDIQQFAEYPGYVEYLTKLKEQHPNWVFVKDEVGKDFDLCVKQHREQGAVAVENNGAWGSEWFYKDGNGNKKYVDTPNWYVASDGCIAAMMDPRNFLNEEQIFQFEDSNAAASYVTLEDVKQVFSNVGWANAEKFSYMDSNKQIVTMDKSFAEIVYDECKKRNFNPLVAAAAIITEQGNGDIPVAKTGKGTVEGYEGFYNYGNVGAFAYAYQGIASAGECGLIRAQKEGWTTPEAAIAGYVEHELKSFSENGKDTKYLRKFDIKGNGSYVYMTSFAGAYNEARLLYKGSNLDQVHVFKIPVFSNMPKDLCPLPGKPGMEMKNVNGGIKENIQLAEANILDYNYDIDEEER